MWTRLSSCTTRTIATSQSSRSSLPQDLDRLDVHKAFELHNQNYRNLADFTLVFTSGPGPTRCAQGFRAAQPELSQPRRVHARLYLRTWTD